MKYLWLKKLCVQNITIIRVVSGGPVNIIQDSHSVRPLSVMDNPQLYVGEIRNSYMLHEYFMSVPCKVICNIGVGTTIVHLPHVKYLHTKHFHTKQ
jgi:hypothetical protein